MAELDNAAKLLLREAPAAFLSLFPDLASQRVLDVCAEETPLPSRSRTVDKLLRVELAGRPKPLWLHVEVQAA